MNRSFGVKTKLITTFIIFSVIVLAILWLLQVVCLDSIYRGIKIHTVRSYSDKIVSVKDGAYDDFVLNAAESDQLCINIYDSELNLISGEHSGGRCVVHTLDKHTIRLFFTAALSLDQKSFESYLPAEDIERLLKRYDFFHTFGLERIISERNEIGVTSENDSDCMVIGKVFTNNKGELRFALISSVIIPVTATRNTIGLELSLITFILILLSFACAYFLSKTITKPIIQLNLASKRLSEGSFSSEGIRGYREINELSDTLSDAAEEIRKVDRLRRELLANVSHDLRTPLTLITGYSEVMRDIPGENTPENLQIVIDETKRLSALVTDLLDLSKLEAGMDHLNREEIEIVGFMSDILNRYDKMISQNGYTVRLEKERDFFYVMADVKKLGQVIYNLINNALHYCGEDKLVVVRLSQRDKDLLIEVRDFGQGIPKDQLNDIWDRYYRVDANHVSQSVGTGLGLSIVKKVLQLHNADFGVESEEGKGSRFWFVLPLVDH